MSAWTTAVAALSTQPVLWWRMDATSQNVGGDQTNSGSAGGTDAGTTGSNTSNYSVGSTSLIVGDSNAAATFNGVATPIANDGFFCTANAGLEPTSAISLCAMIKPSGLTAGNGHIIMSLSDTAGYGYFFIVDGSSGTLHTFMNGTGQVNQEVDGATVLSVGSTYFVVFTYDGTTMKHYISGVQDANTTAVTTSIDYTAMIGSAPSFCVGTSAASGFYGQFQGVIDEAMMMNYALTPTQITSLSNAAFGLSTGPRQPYQPYYQRAPILAQ